jgi:F-type H+-transporting ATPase subunit b
VLTTLDHRSDRIKAELDDARRLKEEAAKLLEEYKSRHASAEREAQDIIASAKAEAERIASEAKAKMEDFVVRRTKTAEGKIALAEAQALADVRAAAANAAVAAASTILTKSVKGEVADNLRRYRERIAAAPEPPVAGGRPRVAAATGIPQTTSPAPDGEVYGCIIFYNGWDAPDRGPPVARRTSEDMSARLAAVSDAFKPRGEACKEIAADVKTHADFRKLLESKDVPASNGGTFDRLRLTGQNRFIQVEATWSGVGNVEVHLLLNSQEVGTPFRVDCGSGSRTERVVLQGTVATGSQNVYTVTLQGLTCGAETPPLITTILTVATEAGPVTGCQSVFTNVPVGGTISGCPAFTLP